MSEPITVCIPCEAGEHHECDTTAWSESDEPVACTCWRDWHDTNAAVAAWGRRV